MVALRNVTVTSSLVSTRMAWAGLSGASYKRSRNFIVPVLQWRSGRGAGKREVRGDPDALWPFGKAKSARNARQSRKTRKN